MTFIKGYKMTEEHKKKIGESNKKKLTEYFLTVKGKKLAINHSKKMLGRKLSEEHKEKIKLNTPIGFKHANWKGEGASYSSKHIWITKELGKPNYCEHCERTDKKKYEWANKDHKYRRKNEDYLRLCTSCHRNYDYKNNLSKKGGRKIKTKI